MNILGLQVTIDRNPSSKLVWTRRAVAIGTAGATVLGGGLAYAFWSTSASGSGTSGTGTPKPLVISSTGVANPADLVPGGAGAVGVKIDNTVSGGNGNNFSVQVSKVNTLTVTSSDETNCPAANVTANQTLPYTLPTAISVGANTSVTTTIASLVKLSSSAPDLCQGKTFTISLTMS